MPLYRNSIHTDQVDLDNCTESVVRKIFEWRQKVTSSAIDEVINSAIFLNSSLDSILNVLYVSNVCCNSPFEAQECEWEIRWIACSVAGQVLLLT